MQSLISSPEKCDMDSLFSAASEAFNDKMGGDSLATEYVQEPGGLHEVPGAFRVGAGDRVSINTALDSLVRSQNNAQSSNFFKTHMWLLLRL